MRWYDMITERVSIRYLLLLCDIKIFSLRKFRELSSQVQQALTYPI